LLVVLEATVLESPALKDTYGGGSLPHSNSRHFDRPNAPQKALLTGWIEKVDRPGPEKIDVYLGTTEVKIGFACFS
jgi:hypothetical protein